MCKLTYEFCHIALLSLIVVILLRMELVHVETCVGLFFQANVVEGGGHVGGLDGVFPLITHVLAKSQFKGVHYLCIHALGCRAKIVGRWGCGVVVDEPFCYA